MEPNEHTDNFHENKTAYRSALISGIFVMAGALEKGLSVNNIVIGAITNDIGRQYSTSFIINSSLSGILMLLVGIWLLFLAKPLKKLQRRAWWQAILISLAFMAFGGGFWYVYPKSIHLPAYLLLGLFLFIPLMFSAWKFKY